MTMKSHQPSRDDLSGPPPHLGVQSRARARRAQIIEAAMRHFAKYGYEDARMEDLANEIGIAKGSIFQYFGSKKRLLLEALRSSASFNRTYLDAPADVVDRGFYATLRYWMESVDSLSREDWIGYRLWIVGNHAAGLDVKHEISRLLRAEDPPGALAFIRFGIERGQVRTDLDPLLLAKTLDLLMDGFMDARFAEECDPGFFRNNGNQEQSLPDRADECVELIRSALGKR
ncbi:MAG: TetR/AcrR family transcriptional regulator [Acidobacteriota bacterium]